MKLAFAGLRHGHIYGLYSKAKEMDGVEVVGAWEENAEARAEAQKTITEPFFETYDEILNNPGIDAVAIGDYYGIRGQLVIRALDAGKHVIADKPICTSLEELAVIREKALAKQLKVACMLDLRYDPCVRKVKQLIAEGKLGKVHAMGFTGQHPLSYGSRPGWYFEEGKHGGTINDIAIHGVDVLRYMTGLEFVRPVSARTWNAYAKEVPHFNDCAQFMAEYEGGAGLIADVSYAAQTKSGWQLPSYWRFTVWGEAGSVEFKYGTGKVYYADSECTEAIEISCEPVEETWLTDFVKPFDAAALRDVLASQEAVLTIQKAADDK
ncbi:MAG: Gfo/Idh/MocA family oxidoreductase [Clostridia bacterium]|nr:Gfo/Idh/MocA family oxidoreductase [Clostridia bacterium]